MDRAFVSVFNMSRTGSFVILIIMLARIPLKRAPKRISYVLWGAAGFRLVFPFSLTRLRYSLRQAEQVDKGIHVADNLKAPFVIGFLNPKIYLPVGLGDRERQYVLLHERTHIKGGDHIGKALACLVLHIHWFNPLAWMAFVFMVQDMEMSCDEHVMKRLGKKARGDYATSLLRMAASPHILLKGSPLAFSEGCTKERVKRVLSFKEPSTMATVVAVG